MQPIDVRIVDPSEMQAQATRDRLLAGKPGWRARVEQAFDDEVPIAESLATTPAVAWWVVGLLSMACASFAALQFVGPMEVTIHARAVLRMTGADAASWCRGQSRRGEWTAFVPESDRVRLLPGATAVLVTDGSPHEPSRTFAARVVTLADAAATPAQWRATMGDEPIPPLPTVKVTIAVDPDARADYSPWQDGDLHADVRFKIQGQRLMDTLASLASRGHP